MIVRPPRTLAMLAAVAALSAGLLALGVAPALADGQVFVVDEMTTSFTPQPGELGWAIEQANSTAGQDTIDIQVDEIVLGRDLPSIEDDVTILGNGATIDGSGNLYATFAIWGASASISDLAVVDPGSSGVYASPGVGDTIVLTEVSVTGATGSSGIGIAGETDAVVRVVGGAVTDSNVGMEISGSTGGIVEVTGTRLAGNAASGFQVTLFGETVVAVDGVEVVGGGTTTIGVRADLFQDSRMTVRDSVISGSAFQGVSANVFNDASLELIAGTEVSGNAWEGVSLFADGRVLVDEATVAGNGTADHYAGIDIDQLYDDGTVTISRSTVSGNGGDGISGQLLDAATLDIVDSTVSGNLGDGIDLDSAARFLLRHSTVTDNGGSGVLLEDAPGDALITHGIVAGNRAQNPDDRDLVAGEDAVVDWSVVGSSLVTAVLVEGDGVHWDVADPGFGPLADNGGLTLTHLLTTLSSALDAGNPAVSGAPPLDQRGLPRVSGGVIDIGAVETQIEEPPAPAGELADTGVGTAWPLAGALALLVVGLGLLFGSLGLLGRRAVRRCVSVRPDDRI